MTYEINLNKINDTYYIDCDSAIENGQRKLLHNEIGCSFVIENGKIKVLGGWHIGTEDFDLEEGDDWVLEKYHPGITEQILNAVKENYT